jgi:hypothetical protein
MMMLSVIPGEEGLAECPSILQAAESFREIQPVL